MNATQMDRWLGRERVRAAKLMILATSLANSDGEVVHEWSIEELNATGNRTGAVFDTCSDYATCKGESVQFRIQYLDHDDRVITATTHRAAPDDASADDTGTEADLSVNRIVAQFMRHDEVREKVLVGALASVFGAAERMVAMQTRMLEKSNEAQQLLMQQLQISREQRGADDARELTEEEKTEALARANAYNKAADLAPIVFEALLEGWKRSHGGGLNS